MLSAFGYPDVSKVHQGGTMLPNVGSASGGRAAATIVAGLQLPGTITFPGSRAGFVPPLLIPQKHIVTKEAASYVQLRFAARYRWPERARFARARSSSTLKLDEVVRRQRTEGQ